MVEEVVVVVVGLFLDSIRDGVGGGARDVVGLFRGLT